MPIDLSGSFDHAARHYDLMVALNPGYHKHLRSAARELVTRAQAGPLLDLGCGSGASTRALLGAGARDVTGVDASPGMLAEARTKDWPAGVDFRDGRAQDLTTVLTDRPPAAGALAAYLFRNVPEPERDAALRGVRDALTPGGWVVIQDYAVEPGSVADAVWTAVCWGVVIPMSAALLRDTTLYRYLWQSGREFDAPDRFMQRLADAGFTDVAARTTTDWQHNILHTFVGRRP
ncbi:methyltransferase domain-containing protein [Mariniluteicoccus flavus]